MTQTFQLMFRGLVGTGLISLSSVAGAFFGWDPDACSGFFDFTPEIDYELDIQPIFDQHCVHCHQPGTATFETAGLDLRPGQSYWNLVGRRSALDSTLWLMLPSSVMPFLVQKVACTTPTIGERMPIGGPFLSDHELALLANWWLYGPLPRQQDHSSVATQAGLTGSWFNPETNGQGMVIEVMMQEAIPRALVYWFTFNDDPDNPEQRWYVGDGRIRDQQGGLLLIYRSTGGLLDLAEPAAELERVGRAILRFNSCTEAVFAYYLDPEEDGGMERTGEIPLSRLSPIEFCED